MSFFKRAIDNIKKTTLKATDKAKDLVQKKDKNVEEMEQIYQGLKLAATNRHKYALKWTAWNQSLSSLCISQNPDVSDKFNTIVELTNKIGEIEESLAKDEDRNAEDYRDVIERFNAVLRKNYKYIDAKQAYKTASMKLNEAKAKDVSEQAKPTYEQKRFKLQQVIEQAKEKKRQKLEELKDTLRDLIEHRDRYNKFKIRRLAEGFTRYGSAIKTVCDDAIPVLEELNDAVRDLRDSGSVNEDNVSRIESKLEQNIDEEQEEAKEPQFDGFA